MFYCQATKKLVPAGESAHKLVTHIRRKTYLGRPKRRKTSRYENRDSEPQSYTATDTFQEVEGQGWEIAREILVCKEYYADAMAKGFQPQVVK